MILGGPTIVAKSVVDTLQTGGITVLERIKENRPTLITYSATQAGAGVLAFITNHAGTLTSGHIFGRTGAVPQSVEDAMTVAAR